MLKYLLIALSLCAVTTAHAQVPPANSVWAGPPSGSPGLPTWRALVSADLPAGGGAVASVTGTVGQITVSPTTGSVVVSLPSTITSAETFSNTVNFTGAFQIAGSNVGLPITLGNGGTSAALTASNGGIVYSTGGAMAILAGTVTASQCLLSGSSSAPTWGSCSGGAAVSSVGNSDGTLTISPTTGAVVASIALSHANTWAGIQTFNSGDFKLNGASSGTSTLNAPGTGGGVATLFAGTDTVAGFSLANGGTNAALTASNGGIVYSTGSALAILAGTVTANQCLLSGSSTAPSWGACAGGGSSSLHQTIITTTGSGTFTPTNTALYKIIITAGGGQGGVGTGSPGGGGGGGGGGGATCYYYATLTASTGYTLTVGAAAANSTFVNGATTVTAGHGGTGNSAGGNGTGASGGAGGTCTNASIGPVAGGDGGSGGSGDLDLTGVSTGIGGAGGGGGGAGGNGIGGNAVGGSVFGSGGGGSGGNGGTIGSGKQGAIIIEGVY